MKTPEIYYLKHKQYKTVLVIDLNNRLIQPVYLSLKQAGTKKKRKFRFVNKFVKSEDYQKKNRVYMQMVTRKVVDFELPAVQLKMFTQLELV